MHFVGLFLSSLLKCTVQKMCISLVYFCLHYWKCTVQKTNKKKGGWCLPAHRHGYTELNSIFDCAVHGCREGAEGGSVVNRNSSERYRCLTFCSLVVALCTASFSAKGSVLIPRCGPVCAVWCWHSATISLFINRSVGLNDGSTHLPLWGTLWIFL